MYKAGWRAGSVAAMAEDGVWFQAPTSGSQPPITPG